jgi:hypothetical protein
MTQPQRLEIPPHLVQQLLRGPQPARKPPEAVEIITCGQRMCFNVDAVEKVLEEGEQCSIYLKGDDSWIQVDDMSYDEFLRKINVTPRQLYAPDTRD